MTEDARKAGGCFSSAASPGCAVIVFIVALLAVLMVEHTFHIFEGTVFLVAGILALGMAAVIGWWFLKRILIWIARRMPEEDTNGSDGGEMK